MTLSTKASQISSKVKSLFVEHNLNSPYGVQKWIITTIIFSAFLIVSTVAVQAAKIFQP